MIYLLLKGTVAVRQTENKQKTASGIQPEAVFCRRFIGQNSVVIKNGSKKEEIKGLGRIIGIC
ncbi:hypothetical protein HMPREF0322_01803 [Desulfitobacterium hafniense DP7]|uniref:Uncharacterized protein n=1 Tax=Desulfitobacterium hafniense DP7 TaxID=537010 RepID=G9XLG9_DESHA|nr:hypothetical protein HMPREF0322_01803 [Desulfitobacterium hafniense DP7]